MLIALSGFSSANTLAVHNAEKGLAFCPAILRVFWGALVSSDNVGFFKPVLVRGGVVVQVTVTLSDPETLLVVDSFAPSFDLPKNPVGPPLP